MEDAQDFARNLWALATLDASEDNSGAVRFFEGSDTYHDPRIDPLPTWYPSGRMCGQLSC